GLHTTAPSRRMMKASRFLCVLAGAAGFAAWAPSAARAQEYSASFEVPLTLSDPCAVFYNISGGTDNGGVATRLVYGEPVDMDTKFHLNAEIDDSEAPLIKFLFHVQGHGNGVGQYSEIKYVFNLNSALKAKVDINDLDPSTFTFNLKARINAQGQFLTDGTQLIGETSNARLNFKMKISFVDSNFSLDAYDWTIECVGDPWNNMMENRSADSRDPVGRGFGDQWNKYAWSGEDFMGGLYIGTKNAWYDALQVLDPATYANAGVQACLAGPLQLPPLYKPLACMELFGDTGDRDSRGSEIWRLDYKKKTWARLFDANDPTNDPEAPQGFRDMVVHNGKLYAAADLGAFITGVTYTESPPFPPANAGVMIYFSEDGQTFEELASCPTDLCSSGSGNSSIRALASYGGYLFVGTLNAAGGQIWRYDAEADDWGAGAVYDTGTADLPIIAELEPYDGQLYVGLGGRNETLGGPMLVQSDPDNNYIMVCETCDGSDFAKAPDLPNIDAGTFMVIKQYVAMGKLWAGTVNFTNGFSLLSYDGTDWEVVVDGAGDGGFYNSNNFYAWSMASVGDRLFLGTFNTGFIDNLPRGQSELWYTDDGENWTQEPLPLGWGPTNYGIRTMVFGNRQLFLGTASNMVMPDVPDILDPLSPGTEIWSIRDTKVNKPGNGKKH
ncbi:hypothetical protein N8071_00525, partial [bacterium]|nr:hypothetical protein [bacterium]